MRSVKVMLLGIGLILPTEAPTSGIPEPSLTRPVTSTSCERAESVS